MLQGQKSGGTTLDEVSSASKIESNNGLPHWFVDAQAEASREFAAEPYPSLKDEHWRFSSVKNLDGATSLARPAADLGARPTFEPTFDRAFPEPGGRVLFVNDQLLSPSPVADSFNHSDVSFL